MRHTSLPDQMFWCPGKFSLICSLQSFPTHLQVLSHGREVLVLALSAPQNEERGGFGEQASSSPNTGFPKMSRKQRVQICRHILTWHFSVLHPPSPHTQACCVAFGGPCTGCSVLCSVGWYQARCFREVDPAMLGEGSQTQAWAAAAGTFTVVLACSQSPAPTSCYKLV